jgi:uncharacterized Zn finger protein
VLALNELFARRLDEKPWEILVLRGIDLHALLAKVRQTGADPDLPPLAFAAPEEPVLYPEAEDADLDTTLSKSQVRWMLGVVHEQVVEAAIKALDKLNPPPAS